MKKVLLLITIVLIIGGMVGVYFYLQEKEILLPLNNEVEYLDKGKIIEKTINPDKPQEGKTIHEGGPYKLGEIVYVQGVGVKLTAIGTIKNALDIKEQKNQLFGVFKMQVLNYNNTPYTINATDVSLEFEDLEGNTHLQSMQVSGYDKWQRINGSFQFGEIPEKTNRTGNIYSPIKTTATKEGEVKVYINKVPIIFKY